MGNFALEGYRLSPQQKQLWPLHAKNPVYKAQLIVRVSGELRSELLEKALRRLAERHQILRTSFRVPAGMKWPLQVIDERAEPAWRELDLGTLDPRKAVAEVRDVVARELDDGPGDQPAAMLRALLVRLGGERHLLSIVLPALCADPWSLDPLARELAALYGELAGAGAALAAEDELIQYIQFAQLQNEVLEGDEAAEGRAYWRETGLEGLVDLHLPFELPPRPGAAFRPRGSAVALEGHPGALELAERFESPIEIFYLAAWAALLWHQLRRPDLVLGAACDGRAYEELEESPGLFAKYLPVVLGLGPETGFRQLVERAHELYSEGLEWQEFFDAGEFGPEAEGAAHFPFCFDGVTVPVGSLEAAGVGFETVGRYACFDRFDLRLALWISPDGVDAAIDGDDERYPAAARERLAGQLRALVASAIERPEAALGELEILGEAERHELLVELNRTEGDDPEDLPIHHFIERQVERHPERAAIAAAGRRWSYGELGRGARRLARALRDKHGVGAETPVGIFFERSPEMVMAILGTLQAGGAYVPLMPEYPDERLGWMLEDTGLEVVLTQEHLVPRLEGFGVRTVAIDGVRIEISEDSAESAIWPISTGQMAYVVFTSGSTGRPKGVAVSHRNLVHSTHARSTYYRDPVRAFLLASPVAFDSSVAGLFWTLCQGGTLVLPPKDLQHNLAAFVGLVAEHGISHLLCLPSVYRLILDHSEPGQLEGLGCVVVAGEACPPALVERHAAERPTAALINEYGPTEGTVWSTASDLGEWRAGTPVPIGRPIARVRVYLLDTAGRPVATGVPGEIFLGGAGIARGYLGRPAWTAERFVPDPWALEAGSRLYRTGDLARWRLDGQLEFLGRGDHQVKIRGYRIELGEVEHALAEHPGVGEVVVVARGEAGEEQLAAYVAAKGGSSIELAELRRFLDARLPEHMVPAHFVELDRLPKNVNGKIDRSALPSPEAVRAAREHDHVAPRNPVEKAMAEVWAEVLGAERVGIDDNFFELGGDSIRSIQLMTRAKERGLHFHLQQLNQTPTIRGLADWVSLVEPEKKRTEREPFALVSAADRRLLPPGLDDAYPLAQLQAGMLFHSELSPESVVYHDVLSYHLRMPFDADVLESALRKTIAVNPLLRTTFDLHGFSEPLQWVHGEIAVPLEIEDLRALGAAEAESRIEAWTRDELAHRYDWTAEPPWRFHVHRLTDETLHMGWSCHHAILDGWSAAQFLDQAFRRYLALLGGDVPPPPPPPETSFRDFVAREREVMAASEPRHFWLEHLEGAEPVPLPRWPGATAEREDRAYRALRRGVPAPIARGLELLANRFGVHLKSVLLAAHARVVASLSGTTEVITGLAANGRLEEAGGERVLGLFLNTLPMRLEVVAGRWSELVLRVAETAREAERHRRFPMAEIQRLKGGERLFESAFNFVNFHVARSLLGLGDIELLDWRYYSQTDLALVATFELDPQSGELSLSLEYDETRWSRRQVEAALGYYLRTLGAIATEPESAVASPLSAAERHQLLWEWGGPAAAAAPTAGLAELFAERAARQPEAVAVTCGEALLSYGELARRARRRAGELRGLGVGPGSIVALAAERSAEAMVSLWAILEAGGAYLPLDLGDPRERLEMMLGDTGAEVAIGPAGAAASLRLDGLTWVESGSPSSGPPAEGSAARPGELAYVMYTSGSTGRPKGVAVPHAAVARLLSEPSCVDDGPGAAWLQAAPLPFDASTLEIFSALLSGARLVFAPPGPFSLAELAAVIEHQRVSAAWLTAGLFHQMAAAHPPTLSRLRRLLAGGDVLSVRHVEELLAGDFRGILVNGYGPTENTVFTTCHPMRPPAGLGAAVPIGRPIAGTRAWVLGRDLATVPLGAVGELYAGGSGLARGYLARPGLTAERFVPDPVGASPGERLYRTGDQARWLVDGTLEFLGRRDRQVKLRGFRIELGEVEAALAEHPRVRSAVVAVRELAGGGPAARRLTAWFTAADPEPSAAELRSHLAERLPDHLIPHDFVSLPEMPLTPRGKLDRRALPAPETGDEQRPYTPPRTPTEETLAGIWAEVFGHERISAEESFFDLGGHSLLATQAVSRLRQVFGIDLPLRQLFETPTVAGLGRFLDAERRRGEPPPPIAPRTGDGEPPASFAQERLWFFEQLEPPSAAYNLPVQLELRGALDAELLARALDRVIERHESLRTTFRVLDGSPRQAIAEPSGGALAVVDLGASASAAEARRRARAEAERPFDLERGPLLRATLWRAAPEHHLLSLTMHHVVSDGWSMGILVRELGELYRAGLEKRPARLGELQIQYADFAVWQRNWLEGEELERQLDFWRRQLEGASPTLELPTDRPRGALGSTRGAQLPLILESGVRAEIEAAARRWGATPFMVLLAAYATFLARTSGQREVVVGSPIANRNRVEIEGLIGFFVNTLVLRVDLSGDPTFTELVARVRRLAFDAYAHQDLPFEKLVAELTPGRDLARTPLFQTLFVLQNTPRTPLELPGLETEVLAVPKETAEFDLTVSLETVSLETRSGAFEGIFEFRRELFDPTTARRWARSFVRFLHAGLARAERRLSELPGLGRAERHQVLAEWGSSPALGGELDFSEAFARAVARDPAAPALVDPTSGEELSYGELQNRAHSLARELARRGVGPEVRVGVLLERSVDLVVAAVAVLETGGVYLPLDPTHPPERRRAVLEDAGAELVLGHRGLGTELETPPLDLGHLDLGCLEFGAGEAPRRLAGPENAAYTIYTSGSTGRPKGVVIPRRALGWYLATAAELLELAPGARLLQFTGIGFDISIEELFAPLAAGATLVLRNEEMGTSTVEFLNRLREWRITNTGVVSSFWHEWVAEVARHPELSPPDLRVVAIGGERALPERVASWWRTVGERVRLLNGYGPTETTVTATAHRVEGEPAADDVPIGRPLAGVVARIFDRHLSPVAPGVVGELCLGGDGLARGYLGRPAATAASFVPDPLGMAGSRLYRTGDLARHLASGEISFLGRGDQQVKIRGHRIELEEIEVVLDQHPAVERCAVVVQQPSGRPAGLVGWVVAAGGTSENELAAELKNELASYLGARLPAYMVPPVFARLDELPLTPSGKVDRRALEARPVSGPGAEAEGALTPTEEILAGLWRELLGVTPGRGDDFFALGGHSLLATRLLARMHQAFGVELPLRELFEVSVLARLAERLDALAGERAALPPLEPAPSDRPPVLSLAQERLWFLDQVEPGNPAYDMPLALRLRGALDPAALAAALGEISRRHEVLRTLFPEVEGEAAPRVVPPPSGWPTVELSALGPGAETELARLVRREAQHRFDLARERPLRGVLVRRGEVEHALLVNLHHIVSDGVSIDLFLAELAVLYRAAAAGTASPLAEPELQYRDFAAWQRSWLRGEVIEELLEYWRGHLGPEPPKLGLPFDRPRPAVPSGRGSSRPFELSAEVSDALRELARSSGATLFMTLLAAAKVYLAAVTGQRGVVVGTPISNRNRPQLEGMIGLFLNTLVLYTELAPEGGDPAFTEILARVRESALGAYAHQDVPFERLVDELVPGRDLETTPLYQVWFVVQPELPPAPELPGLEAEALGFELDWSKFDFAINLAEDPRGVRGQLEYATDLFDAASVDRMGAGLAAVFEAVAENPEIRLGALVEHALEAEKRWASERRSDFRDTLRSTLGSVRRRAPGADRKGGHRP